MLQVCNFHSDRFRPYHRILHGRFGDEHTDSVSYDETKEPKKKSPFQAPAFIIES